jgi:hypothetical protein
MVGYAGNPNDASLLNDQAEQSGSDRQCPDLGALFRRQASREKLLHAPLGIEDAQGGVPRAQEGLGGVDDALEQVVERDLAGQGDLAEG